MLHGPLFTVQIKVYVVPGVSDDTTGLATVAPGENVGPAGDTVHNPVDGGVSALPFNVMVEILLSMPKMI